MQESPQIDLARRVPRSDGRSRRHLLRLSATIVALAVSFDAFASCLRGINLSGAEFGEPPGVYTKDYIYPSNRTIEYFTAKGFNSVRLPFLWERLQPELMKELDAAEKERLADAVAQLKTAGMTVILDPHNYARYRGQVIGSDAVPDAAFGDFWRRLAGEYKNDPSVLFGLMNEPHDMPATQWLSAANAAISGIREAGADNLVLVPGTNWTGAHSWESGSPEEANGTVMLGVKDPGENYAYEVHQYMDGNFSGTSPSCDRAADAVAALKSVGDWLEKNSKRGFLGEFAGAANAECMTGIANMTGLVNADPQRWVGWTYWVAGDWWPATEPMNIQPSEDGDRLQLKALEFGGGLPAPSGSCPALEKKPG